jgi:multimeric flavodoxin WrbA
VATRPSSVEKGRLFVRALCIIGSPRQDGSTAFIVGKMIEGMMERGVKVKRYHPGSLDINYCKGCHACEETRRCVQRDDMDMVVRDLFESDIVVMASPSYWGDVTGQLKVFIDRCMPLCNAKTGETEVPPGKIGVAVAVRAGQSKMENQHTADLEGKVEKIREACELGRKVPGLVRGE